MAAETNARATSRGERDTIRFILDGEIIETPVPDPTRTVLQFLREDLRRTGTKEGCAEGDCGAYTVAIVEVVEIDDSGSRLRTQAVNACIQFLPTLDGKELITVESLKGDDGSLHPVQQAMLECHGSQCGFCTPGFIMSLFALFKNEARPSRRQIDDALAGNLCRCTGYKPIVDAAVRMYEHKTGASDDWLRRSAAHNAGKRAANAEGRRLDMLRQLERSASLGTRGPGGAFHAPRTADELAALLDEYPGAVVLAGGTDVGLWVTKQFRELGTIIYTGRVDELTRIATTDDYIEIGAAVSLTDAMHAIVAVYPTLEELFLRFASPPIRNAGTLGGNVANGSPIGDTMPALLVLDASLVLQSVAGTREIALDEFYLDYRQTALEPGEFVARVRISKHAADTEVQSYKVSKRFDQDISGVCGAYRLALDGDTVADVRIAYGGMAAIPKRATSCEQTLLGREWSEAAIRDGMRALADDFEPITDMRASSDYRRTVCGNLLYRFYLDTRGEGGERVYAYGR